MKPFGGFGGGMDEARNSGEAAEPLLGEECESQRLGSERNRVFGNDRSRTHIVDVDGEFHEVQLVSNAAPLS